MITSHDRGSCLIAVIGALLTFHVAAGAQPAETAIKRAYRNLIDAENKHDLPAVKAMLWDSATTLFVAKAPVGWHGYWGIDDVMHHLHDMYQGVFRIDPAYGEEKVVFLKPDIAETAKIQFQGPSSWCSFGSKQRRAGKWRRTYRSPFRKILRRDKSELMRILAGKTSRVALLAHADFGAEDCCGCLWPVISSDRANIHA